MVCNPSSGGKKRHGVRGRSKGNSRSVSGNRSEMEKKKPLASVVASDRDERREGNIRAARMAPTDQLSLRVSEKRWGIRQTLSHTRSRNGGNPFATRVRVATPEVYACSPSRSACRFDTPETFESRGAGLPKVGNAVSHDRIPLGFRGAVDAICSVTPRKYGDNAGLRSVPHPLQFKPLQFQKLFVCRKNRLRARFEKSKKTTTQMTFEP